MSAGFDPAFDRGGPNQGFLFRDVNCARISTFEGGTLLKFVENPPQRLVAVESDLGKTNRVCAGSTRENILRTSQSSNQGLRIEAFQMFLLVRHVGN
jgi:hypothetical protein